MGKFGIGARVSHEGHFGTIKEKRKGKRRVRFDIQKTEGEGGWWKKDELTLVSAPFQVEIGKFYASRDGNKFGPLLFCSGTEWPWYAGDHTWRSDGTFSYRKHEESAFDLVSEWSEPAPVTAPKLKVGDRVVFNTTDPNYGAVHHDGVLTVVDVSGSDIRVEYPPFGIHIDKLLRQTVNAFDLELWCPKVGDKVRIIGGRLYSKRQHIGKEFTIALQSVSTGDEAFWIGSDSPGIGYVWGTSELEPVVEPVAVPVPDPAPKPAPFKLQVGKSYRDRKGRKIGPLVSKDHPEYPFRVVDNRPFEIWTSAGCYHASSMESDFDLIAEWVEPELAPSLYPLQAGKDYVTRNFKRVVNVHACTWGYPDELSGDVLGDQNNRLFFTDTGKHVFGNPGIDIVGEWVEPVAEPVAEPVVETPVEVKPARKFKVGDKVTFTDECPTRWWFGPHTQHKTGVVLSDSFPKYDVKVDNTAAPRVFTTAYVEDEHIELAPKFKVGDVINWTFDRDSWQGVTIIEIVDREFSPVRATNSDSFVGAFSFDEIELAPTIAIGSPVTIQATGIFNGMSGANMNISIDGLTTSHTSYALPASVVSVDAIPAAA